MSRRDDARKGSFVANGILETLSSCPDTGVQGHPIGGAPYASPQSPRSKSPNAHHSPTGSRSRASTKVQVPPEPRDRAPRQVQFPSEAQNRASTKTPTP